MKIKNEKKQIYEEIPNTGIRLPVTVIHGAKEGKTLLVTSGIHCNEYVGIETALQLSKELEAKQLTGTVILIHPVNVQGFEHNSYNSRVPEDDKNLNRVFPGDKAGTLSEKIADFIVNRFFTKADYYIDLHGGAVQEELTPYVYYVTATSKSVMEKAKAMAKRVHVPFMVGSKIGSGGAYNYAGSEGVPSILIERGCYGLWSQKEVDETKADIMNIMRYLSMLCDEEQDKEYDSADIREVIYEEAEFNGCWYAQFKAGDHIKKGALLGIMKDYFGNVIKSVYAGWDGVILYQLCSLCAHKGEELIVYGRNSNDKNN